MHTWTWEAIKLFRLDRASLSFVHSCKHTQAVSYLLPDVGDRKLSFINFLSDPVEIFSDYIVLKLSANFRSKPLFLFVSLKSVASYYANYFYTARK